MQLTGQSRSPFLDRGDEALIRDGRSAGAWSHALRKAGASPQFKRSEKVYSTSSR
jgi:hypothetical protein